MAKTYKLSVIMPVKDRAENTKKLLDKLKEQITGQVQVVIVENGSTEDMSFLEDYGFTVLHEEITGVAHARNAGLDAARGKYICWIDNDDDIADDYIPTILEHIKSNHDWYTWMWYSDQTPVTMKDLDIKNPLAQNWALWGYCIRRALFKGHRFDETKKAGSDLMIFDIITPETSGYFIEKFMYFFWWYTNHDSLSHKHNREAQNGVQDS